MALPIDISTVGVVGTYVLVNGDPAVGTIDFTATLRVVSGATHTAVLPGKVTGVLNATGDLKAANGTSELRLLCNDDVDEAPVGWTWLVQEHFTNADPTLAFTLAAPAAVSPINLPAVTPAPQYTPLGTTAVTRIGTQYPDPVTGAVVLLPGAGLPATMPPSAHTHTSSEVTDLATLLDAKADKSAVSYNVKNYGAVGDGVTDDRVAIQAAMDAATVVHGRVYLPAGTYRVTMAAGTTPLRALTVSGAVTVAGAGSASVLKLASATGDYTTVFGHASAVDVGGLTIEDLTIDQNNTGNQLTSTVALMAGMARYCLYVTKSTLPIAVRRVGFTDLDNVNTISVSGAVHNLIVRECRFAIGSSPIAHDHSTLYHHALTSAAVWIENNTFTSPGSGSLSAVTAIETHGSAQFVRGNDIRNFQTGINLTGVGHTTGEGTLCEGNTLLDVAFGIQLWSIAYTGGITTGAALKSVTIRSNTIRLDTPGWSSTFVAGASVAGIRLATATLGIENVLIEDNWITFANGAYVGTSNNNAANGIDWYHPVLDAAVVDKRVTIRRNTVEFALATGIRVSCYGEAFAVTDNTVLNPGRGSTLAGGAVAAGYAIGLSMTGVFTTSRVSNNVLLDTQATHTMDTALWLYPLATGGSGNDADGNFALGYANKAVQTHATYGGWKLKMTTAGFTSPGGMLAVDSAITDRATGVLYRQTAAPEGATWFQSVSVAFGSRPLSSTYYLGPSGGSRTTVSMTSTVEYAVPLYVASAGTLSTLGIEVTIAGTAGTRLRLGIRGDDGTGLPGPLVLDAGTVAGDAIATVETTITYAVTPGIYWLTATAQITGGTLPTVRAVTGDLYPCQASTLAAALGATHTTGYITASGTTAALPAPYTTSGRTGVAPRVVAKVT